MLNSLPRETSSADTLSSWGNTARELFGEVSLSPTNDLCIGGATKALPGCHNDYSEKMGMCATTLTHLEFVNLKEKKESRHEYHTRWCYKQFCRSCGGKDGMLNGRRKRRALKKLEGVGLNPLNSVCKIVVATVPGEYRNVFTGFKEVMRAKIKRDEWGKPMKDDWSRVIKEKVLTRVPLLEDLYHMGEKLAKHLFPGVPTFVTVHMFGEKPGVLHPHVNVIAFEEKKGQLLKKSDEDLKHMKDYWAAQLGGYLKRKLDTVVVDYSFRYKAAKILHTLKYYLRPMGHENYMHMSDDLRAFFTSKALVNFKWVRTVQFPRNSSPGEETIGAFLEDAKESPHERIIIHEDIKKEAFHLQFKSYEYDVVRRGVYRIKQELPEWSDYYKSLTERKKKKKEVRL